MKSILDKKTRVELIARINSLDEKKVPEWGKINVYQMLRHCCLTDELYLGKKKYDRVFLGRIFGKLALKSILKEGAPFPKNAQTGKGFIVTGDGDVTEQKKKLIAVIDQYETFSSPFVVHWFFGKMTKEQVGQLSHKHLDHHLQQFGV